MLLILYLHNSVYNKLYNTGANSLILWFLHARYCFRFASKTALNYKYKSQVTTHNSQVIIESQNAPCQLPCKCILTLFRPMEFCIKLLTRKSGWSNVCIEGITCPNFASIFCMSSSEDRFCLSKQGRPWRYATFHLGLHCLPKSRFRGFWSVKG